MKDSCINLKKLDENVKLAVNNESFKNLFRREQKHGKTIRENLP